MVKRYKEVLAIFRTGKNMAKSFQKYGVDRLTIVKTADIAGLTIAAPEEFQQVDKGGTMAEFSPKVQGHKGILGNFSKNKQNGG